MNPHLLGPLEALMPLSDTVVSIAAPVPCIIIISRSIMIAISCKSIINRISNCSCLNSHIVVDRIVRLNVTLRNLNPYVVTLSGGSVICDILIAK